MIQDRAEKITGHIRGVWRCLNRKEKKAAMTGTAVIAGAAFLVRRSMVCLCAAAF